jgi:hypothetical protein
MSKLSKDYTHAYDVYQVSLDDARIVRRRTAGLTDGSVQSFT